eukprot:1755297-Rhodomonas_salina.1
MMILTRCLGWRCPGSLGIRPAYGPRTTGEHPNLSRAASATAGKRDGRETVTGTETENETEIAWEMLGHTYA